MRVFQASIHQGKEQEFSKFFHETAIPLIKQMPGLISVSAGAPRSESPTEFSMVTIWRDLDALREFTGEDYANPTVHPDEAELVRVRSVKHYQLVD
ncbi:MAG: antibiotic biosynthesis monooxygenase [Pseudomonadota bacterium]